MFALDERFIEQHATEIVRSVRPESVAVYRFLAEMFATTAVNSNYLFQFVFRSFYRLDNAGLTDIQKVRFFELLESARQQDALSISHVVRELHALPNRKGQKTLQFSFASKLAATVDPSLPIYDSEVARMFGFSSPSNTLGFEKRLEKFTSFHAHVSNTYDAIVARSGLAQVRQNFRGIYGVTEHEVPETKVIDFIVWQAGKLKKRAPSQETPSK